MTVTEILAAAAALSPAELRVLLAAAQARLSRDAPEPASFGAVYGGPPPQSPTAWMPHVVVLRSCGPKRELLIMQVRTALAISLGAAKAIVDAAPCEFATFPDEFAAVAFAGALAALGADVEVRVAP